MPSKKAYVLGCTYSSFKIFMLLSGQIPIVVFRIDPYSEHWTGQFIDNKYLKLNWKSV